MGDGRYRVRNRNSKFLGDVFLCVGRGNRSRFWCGWFLNGCFNSLGNFDGLLNKRIHCGRFLDSRLDRFLDRFCDRFLHCCLHHSRLLDGCLGYGKLLDDCLRVKGSQEWYGFRRRSSSRLRLFGTDFLKMSRVENGYRFHCGDRNGARRSRFLHVISLSVSVGEELY